MLDDVLKMDFIVEITWYLFPYQSFKKLKWEEIVDVLEQKKCFVMDNPLVIQWVPQDYLNAILVAIIAMFIDLSGQGNPFIHIRHNFKK